MGKIISMNIHHCVAAAYDKRASEARSQAAKCIRRAMVFESRKWFRLADQWERMAAAERELA